MCFDDATADGETNTHSGFSLGREKRCIVFLEEVGWQSRAIVADRDLNRFGIDDVALHQNVHMSHVGTAHRFQCIAEQIDENLLDLHAIREHENGCRIELVADRHVKLLLTDKDKRHRIPQSFVDAFGTHFRIAA